MTDHETRTTCRATTKLYEVHGEDARCSLVRHHNGPHQVNATPDSKDANIVSWHSTLLDNQARATCRATLHLGEDRSYDCVRPENHPEPHADHNDTWDITYRDPKPAIPFVMNVRPVQDQLTDLATRVGLLEATWKIGGETLKEWVERNILGVMEQIRVHEHQPGAVLIDPTELGSLLKDREELHTLRNTAQADVTIGCTGCTGPCCE